MKTELKNEFLNAMSDLNIYAHEFEHTLEDTKRTYAKLSKYIETDNLNITIELEEEAHWDNSGDYESQGINISKLEIYQEGGLIEDIKLSDETILKHINY